MSPVSMPVYDEAVLRRQLASVGPEALVAFAASCGERLFVLYELFAVQSSLGDVRALRSALDLAWCGGQLGARPGADAAASHRVAESLVPPDGDGQWMALSPLAQNAAAAVAYALGAWISGDVQEGVWAARQVHEAADVLVQTASPRQEYAALAETDSAAVLLIEGIGSSLAACCSGESDGLRARAVADGERLLVLMRGEASSTT